jgi:translocation and assembly module TamB
MRRRVKIPLIGAITLGLLVVSLALLLTNSDWGRERVRRQLLSILQGQVNGRVSIGRVSGNLLTGATIADVAITDSAGNPFVTADTLHVAYRLRALLSRRIQLWDVRLVRPLVVLDRRPGQDWNFVRLFAGDTTPDTSTAPGWGDWISIEDARIIDGRVIVRMPWSPDSTLAPAARDSAVVAAFGPEGRLNLVHVPGGYQAIHDFQRVFAALPLLRIADAAFASRHFEIASLRSEAYIFRPPAAEIADLAGVVDVNDDSLWFRATKIELPGSRITGRGTIDLARGDVTTRLVADTASLADLRWLYPRLPAEGGGRLDLQFLLRGDTTNVVAREVRLRTGSAAVEGDLGMLFLGDTVGFRDTDLRIAGVRTELVEQLVPGLELPVRGAIAGVATLDGTLRRLRVDGDVTFDDAEAGRSRVIADGIVGVGDGAVAADGLRVDLRPVQVSLARAVVRDLPVGGTITGTATLDGSSDDVLRARMDLVHVDRGARSRVHGSAAVSNRPGLMLAADARLDPLSLVTVGRFAPAVKLRGSVAGPVQLRGPLGDLRLTADLAVAGGGNLTVRGRFDLDGRVPGYDLRADARLFDASAVLATAPTMRITGRMAVNGRGVDPATMRAAAAADLAASSMGGATVDSVIARVAVAGGMASADTLLVLGPGARIAAGGTFGLRPDRVGALAFDAVVDSLEAFAQLLAGTDTTSVAARPLAAARARERTRADSAARAERAEVERLATGAAAPVQLARVDSGSAVSRDSVAGAVFAKGVVRGNLGRVEAEAVAGAQGLVLRGNVVRQARLELRLRDGLTPAAAIEGAAHLDTVLAAGFALDSADARIRHELRGTGTADVVIVQDDRTDYRFRANYRLALDESELTLDQLALRFDSLTWRSQQPGVVRWSERRVQVEHLDLRSGEFGRVYADGVIPLRGEGADFEVLVRDFEVSSLLSLLQSDVDGEGRVSLTARLAGTAEAPRMEAALGVAASELEGAPLPTLRTRFTYADEALELHAEGLNPLRAEQLFRAEAVVPVNLAIRTDQPRLPDRPVTGRLLADSLPLGLIPSLTDAVTTADGAALAAVTLNGTVRAPKISGALALDRVRLGLAANGVTFTDMTARIRITHDTVIVDSLVARSGGRVIVRGGIGIDTISRPAFDIFLAADNARVLNNEYGELFADARLAMRGPYDGVYVSGTTLIRGGVFYIPEPAGKNVIPADDPLLLRVADTTRATEAEIVPRQNPLLDNLRVDVNLDVLPDTWVRSKDANVQIYTPEESGPLEFSLDQRQGRLVLEGVVSTERGEYSFAGRSFQLQRGSVIFTGTPEINPLLQLTGQFTVRLTGQSPLNIRVLVGGTLEQPRVTLESDAQPPLSQSDLISYLAFGQGSGSLLQFQGSGLASGGVGNNVVGSVAALGTAQLAAVGLNVLVESTEQRATRSLGLDVFNITPAPIPVEALDFSGEGRVGFSTFVRGTEFEFGKYLNPNTFASATVRPGVLAPNASDRPVPGLRVEHRFGTGYTVDASFGPQYLLRLPSLRELDRSDAQPVGTFGLYLSKEWRW